MSASVAVTTRRPEAAVVTDVTTDHAHLGDAFDAAFHELVAYMKRHGIEPTGPGFAVYHEVSPNEPWHTTVGFPVKDPGPGENGIHAWELPGGKVAVIVHEGPYEGLAERWSELGEWLRTHHLTPAAAPWESYLVEDSTEPEPARWRTEIVWPVR